MLIILCIQKLTVVRKVLQLVNGLSLKLYIDFVDDLFSHAFVPEISVIYIDLLYPNRSGPL